MPKGTLKRAAESKLAGQIREEIGADADEEIQIVTPEFEREPGYPLPGSPPEDWESLKTLDVVALKERGLRPWGCPEDDDGTEHPEKGCLWLFPGEWYSAIPAGLSIVTIFFEEERFVPGQTDDDIRFGCLSYGVMGPALPSRTP